MLSITLLPVLTRLLTVNVPVIVKLAKVNVELVVMVVVGGSGMGGGVHDCGGKRCLCATGAYCATAYTASTKVYQR